MFDENKKSLDELRTKNQDLVDKRFDKFIRELKSEMKVLDHNNKDVLDKLGIYKDKDIFCLVMVYALIIVFSLFVLVPQYVENLGLFFFGFVFFVAGMQIGLGKDMKGFGLIFVFSHGGTGLGILLASLLMRRIDMNVLTDLSGNMKAYAFFTIVLMIFSFLAIVIYNLSETLKIKKYNKVIILLLFTAVIFLVGMFPILKF